MKRKWAVQTPKGWGLPTSGRDVVGGVRSLKGHALELQEEAVTRLPVFSREFPSHADVTISFQTQRS